MIIALNNKSNLTLNEFNEYQNELNSINTEHHIIVCPTFLNVSLYNAKHDLGAQNVSIFNEGAYTGEVCAEDLSEFNVKYCIVGHSERRQYQRETLKEINEKVKRLKENNITPILCVGETKEQRDENKYKEVVKEELETAIEGIEDVGSIIIAYEPIWSIGTGIIPTNEQIEEMFNYIKTLLPNNKILYGGSANENNIDTLKQIELIDGYLLGGLSLKPDKLQVFIDKLEK